MNDKPQEQEHVCPLLPDKYTRVGVIYQRFGGGCCLLWRWARDIIDVLVALALALEFSWSVVDFDLNTCYEDMAGRKDTNGGKKIYERKIWREKVWWEKKKKLIWREKIIL